MLLFWFWWLICTIKFPYYSYGHQNLVSIKPSCLAPTNKHFFVVTANFANLSCLGTEFLNDQELRAVICCWSGSDGSFVLLIFLITARISGLENLDSIKPSAKPQAWHQPTNIVSEWQPTFLNSVVSEYITAQLSF